MSEHSTRDLTSRVDISTTSTPSGLLNTSALQFARDALLRTSETRITVLAERWMVKWPRYSMANRYCLLPASLLLELLSANHVLQLSTEGGVF